jgi:hypothetical protein
MVLRDQAWKQADWTTPYNASVRMLLYIEYIRMDAPKENPVPFGYNAKTTLLVSPVPKRAGHDTPLLSYRNFKPHCPHSTIRHCRHYLDVRPASFSVSRPDTRSTVRTTWPSSVHRKHGDAIKFLLDHPDPAASGNVPHWHSHWPRTKYNLDLRAIKYW